MAKPRVLISAQVTRDTESKSFGSEVMNLLFNDYPVLTPEFVSSSETSYVSYSGIDDLVEHWWSSPVLMLQGKGVIGERFDGFFWKRKSPIVSRGMVSHGLTNVRGIKTPSSIWLETRWSSALDFFSLFKSLVSVIHPSVAMLHVFPGSERDASLSPTERAFSIGSFGGPANPGIPNMGWAMAFDSNYTSMIDIEHAAKSGFNILSFEDGFIISVTQSLSDVLYDPDKFETRRRAALSLFSPGTFRMDN